MANTSTVTQSSINQGLDRKNLKIVSQRFMQVNQARLARTRLALNRQQQYLLDLIPLFFHVNHPMMPGFVSRQTPKGVANYEPKQTDIQKAQRIARSFTYPRQPKSLCQIEGIYLMGSCGTIGQSGVSDLDFWLSHSPGLNPDELAELQRKCQQIEQFAASYALEVHFFLMDADKFRKGERSTLSTEDCGSTQHFLLLDEFYRSNLLIAGKPSIWWMVPPSEEIHYGYYTDTLRHKRYLLPNSTVDFGGIPQIPAGEFIGAGIWQLYKGIISPYKSVLKLLLIEVYASEYPRVLSLSALFKQAIYNDQLDIDELDPYVLIYRKLEQYLLKRKELKRLELVRRCFYLKVGKKLSRPPQHRKPSWQRLLLQKLVNEWGWPRAKLIHLDNQANWKAPQVIEERKELVRELTTSYRFLAEFARSNQSSAHINAQDMAVLGRKLYAAFERRAGKVEMINPGITSDLVEESLSFYPQQRQGETAWSLHAEQIKRQDLPTTNSLKRGSQIMELIVWAHFNGLLDHSSKLTVAEGEHQLDDLEVNNLARALQQHLPAVLAKPPETSQPFTQPAQPMKMLLFINVGIDPMEAIKKRGLHRLSDNTNSLGYSGLKENLVLSIDMVSINSWHEISVKRFDGDNALLKCLKYYLETIPPDADVQQPQREVVSYCASRAPAIAQRVDELFNEVSDCFYNPARNCYSRFVLQIQNQFHILQYLGENQVRLHHTGNEPALLHYLSEPQPRFSQITLDRYTLPHSALSAISPLNSNNAVQVFYLQAGGVATIYVLDEQGSISHFQTPWLNVQTLLQPLAQFLQSCQFRQISEARRPPENMLFGARFSNLARDNLNNSFELDAEHRQTLFYELRSGLPGQPLQAVQRSLAANIDSAHFFNVQAIAERDHNDQIVFNIYCDQQEFSALEFGDQLYQQVARFILARRKNNERYPCYITDLDLSQAFRGGKARQQVQTSQYLRYKQLLEKRINQALRQL